MRDGGATHKECGGWSLPRGNPAREELRRQVEMDELRRRWPVSLHGVGQSDLQHSGRELVVRGGGERALCDGGPATGPAGVVVRAHCV